MYNHSNTLAKPVVHLYTWCKSTESKKINRPKVLGSRGTRAREWFKAWGEKGGTSVWDEEKRGGNSSIVVGRRRNKREEEEGRARGGGVWVLEEDGGKGMPPFIPRTYDAPMCENTTTGSWRPPPDLAAVARFQLWLAPAPFNTRLRTGCLVNLEGRGRRGSRCRKKDIILEEINFTLPLRSSSSLSRE